MSIDIHLPQPLPPSGPFATAQPAMQAMDLKQAAYMLRRHARLIVKMIWLGAAVGLIVALMMIPMYKSQALIMIEPRRTDLVNIEAVLSPLAPSLEIIHSEMEIILSRAVIDRVIDKLNLLDDPEFRPSLHFWRWLNPARWGDEALSDAEREAQLRTAVAMKLEKGLTVENDGRSYVITISFLSDDARKAARIANGFAEAYLADQMDAKYQTVSHANAWLNGQLEDLKANVEESEKAVENYRQKHQLIQLDNGSTIVSRQMDDINTQLGQARADLSQAEAKLGTARALLRTPGGIDSAGDVLASPLIQNLREQEAELRQTQADLASRYGPLHPKVLNARAQYQDLEKKITEEAQRIVQGLAGQVDIARNKERQVEAQLDSIEKHASADMKESVALHQLQREADANREIYENFLNRFKQTSAQSDMQTSDARVIASADVAQTPSFPNKFLFLVVGALLGAMIGVIAAYMKDYFDKGFRHAGQVEENLGAPVIGHVPDVRALTPRRPEDYVAEKPLSAYGEALRTVRMAVHFSNAERPPKTVMVTSSVPGEGKTSFCVSLARLLAHTGNRVLLIDADMRRPRVAAVTGTKKVANDLASVLSGESTFANAIKPDPVVRDLDIVFAAGGTANAQDLLSSAAMNKLVQDAANYYDLILIDTPPILAVSDAAMVARVSDATIFLVRWAETPRDQAVAAFKQLANLKCRIAGVVLSQVDLEQQAKYTDGYTHRNYAEYHVN